MRKGDAPARPARRNWLKKAGGLAFLAILFLPASFLLRPAAPGGGPPPPEVRAATLSPIATLNDASVSAWGLAESRPAAGSFTLQDGATWGIYYSPVFPSDFPFNAVALSWKADEPEGSEAVIEIRARPDSGEWSEWFKVEPLDGASVTDGEHHSQLIVAYGSSLQYGITLYATEAGRAPVVGDVKITYFDSSQGPSPLQPQAAPAGRRPSDITQPTIISRAAWGSPEPDSSTRWPPSYKQWTKVAVHDTVTKNDDPNPAATVRAIWYYHANTLGWGDVGYNYLIDTQGNIYQGRFGGENATGGHVLACYNPGSMGVALLGDYRYADVTPAMSGALTSLLAAKTYQHNIDPLGAGNFGGPNYDGTYSQKWLNNIFAHRDVYGSCGNNHTDPGTNAYNLLPDYRNQTWNAYPDYGEVWVDQNTPQRMLAGATASVAVTVKNTGRAVWANNNGFRLAFRWFAQDGAEVAQAGGGNQRASLPQDIPFGQTVMIVAQIAAPARAGTFTLQWDMVQDGVTWFSDQGNTPLNATVTVTVTEPTYIAEPVAQSPAVKFFPGDRVSIFFDLKNTGTAAWYRTGDSPVRLGTYNPPNRGSAFATYGDWPGPSRATEMDQDRVLPGQVGRFTFVATAPAQTGNTREYFNLVAEGKGWFGPPVSMEFSVLRPIKLYVPELMRAYLGSW